VRSANRAARVAEAALLADLRPLLVESSEADTLLRVGFKDINGIAVAGGRAAVELIDDRIYIVLSLRNVGRGIAVLHGGYVRASQQTASVPHAEVDQFRMLSRDLYIPPGAVGFWQIAWRPGEELPPPDLLRSIEDGVFTVEILYGDFEGAQRTVTRFGVRREDDGAWSVGAVRHWQLDRADPRPRD
jgi:hypothetical protein